VSTVWFVRSERSLVTIQTEMLGHDNLDSFSTSGPRDLTPLLHTPAQAQAPAANV